MFTLHCYGSVLSLVGVGSVEETIGILSHNIVLSLHILY
jgi:hypothetical protein